MVRRFGYKFIPITILSVLFALLREVQKQDKPEETGQDNEHKEAGMYRRVWWHSATLHPDIPPKLI